MPAGTEVRLTVYGAPRPRGSHALGRRRDGTAFVRSAGREETWVETVARSAMWRRSQGGELPGPPYRVELAFYMPAAKRPVHQWPTRGDVDKLARAVLDGLVVGGLLVDDCHVVELLATKVRATAPGGEGVHVVITTAAAAGETVDWAEYPPSPAAGGEAAACELGEAP